jgi:hypothetical protein
MSYLRAFLNYLKTAPSLVQIVGVIGCEMSSNELPSCGAVLGVRLLQGGVALRYGHRPPSVLDLQEQALERWGSSRHVRRFRPPSLLVE